LGEQSLLGRSLSQSRCALAEVFRIDLSQRSGMLRDLTNAPPARKGKPRGKPPCHGANRLDCGRPTIRRDLENQIGGAGFRWPTEQKKCNPQVSSCRKADQCPSEVARLQSSTRRSKGFWPWAFHHLSSPLSVGTVTLRTADLSNTARGRIGDWHHWIIGP